MPSGLPARFPTKSLTAIKDRILAEGFPFHAGGSSKLFWYGRYYAGGVPTGDWSLGTANNAYRAVWIDSVTLTANVPVVLQVSSPYLILGGSPAPASSATAGSFCVGPSGITIPMNQLLGADSLRNMSSQILSVPSQDPALTRAFVSNSGGNALTIVKGTSGYSSIDAGNTRDYYYDLTVSNSSGSTASGTTTITDTIPPDADVVSTSGSGWTVSVSGQTLTATSTTSVANGGTMTALRVTLRARTAVHLNWSAHGYQCDFDVTADLPTILWCGTSISAGTGTTYANSYPYLMRNWFRDTKNINTRVLNKAISGTQSSQHEYLRAFTGRYTVNEPPFMVCWEHGINDVIQGVTTATTQQNLTAWLRYWNTFYPSTWCVVLSPFPTGNTTNESNLATLRTALASTMTSIGGSKNVWVSGTGNMFNPVTQINTYTGDGIHLNDAGCALAATTIQSALNSYF
jgi:lysophospholipase L1-like esterase